MKLHRLLVVLALGIAFPAHAQDKDTVIEGQVKIGVHKLKLEAGSLYQIEVKAKSFAPNLQLLGSFLPNTADFFKERNTYRGMFFPPKSGEFTLLVSPNTFGGAVPEGLLDYTLTLKTMKLDPTPVLKQDDKVTKDDPKYARSFNKTAHKSYAVKFKAGQTYIIDMVRGKGIGNAIDPYLYLENPKNNLVAQDDDGGGFPNARIMYRATEDGEFRIIASGLSDRSNFGDFTLTVRTIMKSDK